MPFFFQRPHYKSDVTRFIEDLKKEHPYLDAQQQAGRKLLWDKQVNQRTWQDLQAGEVQKKPYTYYQDDPEPENPAA